jgi:hypothetical protein
MSNLSEGFSKTFSTPSRASPCRDFTPSFADLKHVLQSMRDAAEEAGAQIVTGDSEVVRQGAGSGVECAQTIAEAAVLPNIDTVITGRNRTTLTMADLKMYMDFNREFVEIVKAAKKAGRTIDDVGNSWKAPDRFLENGRLTPDAYQKVAGKPMSERLRANVELVWKETK